MDTAAGPLLIGFVLFVALGAVCSAMETAFSAANRIRLKASADGGDARARTAAAILEHFDEALTAILIVNNVMHTAAASVATLFSVRTFGDGSVTASTLIVTAIIFFFGEMLPKRYARDCADRFALLSARPLRAAISLLRPVTRVFMRFSERLTRRFPEPDEPTYTEDELHDLVENLEDDGELEIQQQELVESAMDFGGKRAGDIYIPMRDVVSLPDSASREEILSVMKEKRFSRYPVVSARNGRVTGMLQAYRYLSACVSGQSEDLRRWMKPLRSYGADMHIDDLMHAMSGRRQHMALVVDEAGKTLGIVTMEDILEELVGEIYDEKDPAAAASAPSGKEGA
ncbi:MAG: HlyC/CorC family transporter [Clostridia bacterium]|nr:HlyC/CorC family transporter [Clostridia bacterium]